MMDFAVGSWVRFGESAWLVQNKRESIHMLDLVRVGDGAWTTTTPEGLSPWTPRVGDWVRWEGARVDRGGLTREAWRVESVHDGGCAGANRDGGFVHSFRAPDCRLIPAPPPTQAVERAEVEERIAVELLNRPRPVGSLFGIDASTYRIADYVDPVIAPPPAPRGNTTCTRCGGPALVLLNDVECMAAKCESPAELEPDDVIREVDGHLAKWPLVRAEFAGKRYDECREWHTAHVEPTYVAIGRGVVAKHPTEEGARAAWRLAVGGGR
jgi:hypothetical protein